jgi:uncharacterized membrane protein
METLAHLFAWVCGQHAEHTWSPGGLLLPCCQRCTGLYAGACVAALLHLALRPRRRAPFLAVHGAFLVLMVPFGCHWLPQGPALRALTGVLAGAAIVTFLALAPAAATGTNTPAKTRWPSDAAYFGGVALAACLVPAIAAWGAQGAALLLAGLTLAGLLALAALAARFLASVVALP